MAKTRNSTPFAITLTLLTAFLFFPHPMSAAPGDLLFEIPNPEGPNGLGASLFGKSLATLGPNLIVGAPGSSLGINSGQVYLFDGQTGDTLLTIPNPGRSSSRFGSAIAPVDNNILISSLVGGLGSATDNVRLFDNATGNTLFSLPPLSNSFGASLTSVNGNMVIGEPQGAGSVHIYDGIDGNLLLTIPNPRPQMTGSFGASLANNGQDILIGSPSGTGHVFLLNGQTGNPLLTIPDPNPDRNEYFGASLATLGPSLLIGSPPNSVWKGGAVYLFDGTTGDILLDIYDANPGFDVAFGASVASLGSNIVVTAPGQTFGYGDLFVFDSHNGNLIQRIPDVCGTKCTIVSLNNNIAIAKPGLAFGRLQTIKVFEGIPSINGVLILNGRGTSYAQNFDNTLGNNGSITNTTLPQGWLADNNGFSTAFITDTFPPEHIASSTYNAGFPNNQDRTLATGNTSSSEQNKIQLYAQIQESEVWAVRLAFDIEVWGADANIADNPGEAAFAATLEIFENGSFSPLLDFGVTSTGTTLIPPNPADGVLIDGNADGHYVSFDSGVQEIFLPENSTIRLAWKAQDIDDTSGYIYGLDNVLFRLIPPGDSDGDGDIDSFDIQNILAANKFGAGPSEAAWFEGDFNYDDQVDSFDIQMILATNLFGQGPYGTAFTKASIVPEPPSLTLLISGLFIALASLLLKSHTNNKLHSVH